MSSHRVERGSSQPGQIGLRHPPSVAVVAASSLLILLGFLWDHPVAHAAVALLVVLLPLALADLATGRAGRRRLRPWLVALAAILAASLEGILLLQGVQEPTFLGLPLSSLLLLLGLWLVPLVLVIWSFAATFDEAGPKPLAWTAEGDRPAPDRRAHGQEPC